MFVLKQLVRDQITFHNNRYGSAPEVVEILEDEFMERVSFGKFQNDLQRFFLLCIYIFLNIILFFSQARQINIDNVSTLYDCDMFQKNRFIHDKKRKLIIQTLWGDQRRGLTLQHTDIGCPETKENKSWCKDRGINIPLVNADVTMYIYIFI